MIFQWGALDFAGGTVVHINAGIAGLVGCLDHRQARRLRPRADGAAFADDDDDRRLAAVGRLVRLQLPARTSKPTARPALAMINTFVATAAAALAWMLVEWIRQGQAVAARPRLGRRRRPGGDHAGLRLRGSRWAPSCWAWSPASVCFIFCTAMKNALGYDDSLDVFGVHCIGGIIGAIAHRHPGRSRIWAGPASPTTSSKPGELAAGEYVMATQVIAQIKAVRD